MSLSIQTSYGKRPSRKGYPQRLMWTVTANGRKYSLTKFCEMLGISYLSIRQTILARGADGYKEFPAIVAAARKRAERAASMHQCPLCKGTGKIKDPPAPAVPGVDHGAA